jgi:hypothetical protein
MKIKRFNFLYVAEFFLGLARLLLDLRSLIAPAPVDPLDELNALRAENLRLKNEREFIRHGVESNRVIEGDLKIELLKLKIAREKWSQDNAGIDAPTFTAADYDDPGDVRRGKYS